MKSRIKLYLLLGAITFSTFGISACSRGYGCPAESANVKPDRKGRYGSKKGSSNLFPKDMRKKVGTH